MGICQAPGACGQAMHGRPYPFQMGERWNGRSGVPGNSYDFREGRVVCGQINAGWQLADVGPDDGGFLVIPVRLTACDPASPACLSSGLNG